MYLFDLSFWNSFFANFFAALLLAFLFFLLKEKIFKLPDIAGIFYLKQITSDTTYKPYKGMELQYVLSLRLEGNKVRGSAEKIYEDSSKGKKVPHIIHYEGKDRSICNVRGDIQKRYLSFYDILVFHSFERNETRKSTTYYKVRVRKKYILCGELVFYKGIFESTIASQKGTFNIEKNKFEQKEQSYYDFSKMFIIP